jgi:hypothetical protein
LSGFFFIFFRRLGQQTLRFLPIRGIEDPADVCGNLFAHFDPGDAGRYIPLKRHLKPLPENPG